MKAPPIVLVFSALDGTGGAGVVADCRAVAAAGALPLSVAAGVSAQNLDGVAEFWPLSPPRVRAQFAAIQNADFAACKIGVVGRAAAAVAASLPAAALTVWDPVLSPTCGAPFADDAQKKRMLNLLLPRADIVTPNCRELAVLSGRRDVAGGARALLDGGARMVLATGIRDGARMRHELYGGEYHGGGCFFSATLAARLARGDSAPAAADFALRATLAAIDNALSLPSLGAQKLPIPAPPA